MAYFDINIQAQSITDFYKPILIEDIVANHPVEAHYGKCSVIGKIVFDESQKLYYLESLRIPALTLEMQLPDGYFRIRLLTGLLRGNLHLNHTVEVIGEILLWNLKAIEYENSLPKTSHDLCLELKYYYHKIIEKTNLSPKEFTGYIKDMDITIQTMMVQQLKELEKQYKIVLRPFHILPCSNAGDIISLNLEIKFLRAKHSQKYSN